MHKVIVTEIQKLELKPDDMLIVKLDPEMSLAEIEHLKEVIEETIPEDVTGLVVWKDIEFMVVRKTNGQTTAET